MDGRTKSIILGVLVVVGMAVILMPFFQSSEDVASSTTLVKAPPFPDQAVQVQAPEQVAAAPENKSAVVAENTTPPVNATPDDQTQTQMQTQQPEVNEPTQNSPLSDTTTTTPAPQQDEKPLPAAAPTSKKSAQQTVHHKVKIAKATKPVVKVARVAKVKVTHTMKEAAVDGDDGLFSLKNPAWVVQLGSFKNKANALRLVNELRANGYSAFIQRFSSSLGDNTRVFVGPEMKHDSARQVANSIESDMHLHGIVISYKPLTL